MREKELGGHIITIDNVCKTFLGSVQAVMETVKDLSTKISRREVVVTMRCRAASTVWRSRTAAPSWESDPRSIFSRILRKIVPSSS